MKNKVFGLDIGATSIKAVWIDKEKEGYFLNSVLTAETPAKGMISESPLDQEEMAQAITKIITDANITTRSVNIALPENQVFTKIIEMPLLSEKELASAIYWEAEQYIPVPLANVTLDYKVISSKNKDEKSPKMDVLLVGAPTMLINKYVKVMSMSGLYISAVETEIISIIRSTVIEETFPSSMIIHIGAISTSLAIVRQGTLTFIYSIPTGGMALTRAIAADFGLSLTQAEEYKKVYGLSENSLEGKIGKATEPVITSILTEIKKALAFYNEKYVNDSIKQIILSGGTAKLTRLNTFFANNVGIETVIANPWKVLATQDIPKEILDDAPEYTIAVGLAMRE